MKKAALRCLLLITFLAGNVLAEGVSGSVSQSAQPNAPHAVIAETTDRMLALIAEAKEYYKEDPDRYYEQIETILEPVVDFESFARAVMGRYGSKRYYHSLATEEQKQEFMSQVRRFSTVFKRGLVQAYGKGLMAFSGERVEVINPDEGSGNQKSVNVRQRIYNNSDKPFEVTYKLRQDDQGNWMLRNVTIQAINLGKVYRNQFAAAAKKYDGNIDEVINNWLLSESEASKSS